VKGRSFFQNLNEKITDFFFVAVGRNNILMSCFIKSFYLSKWFKAPAQENFLTLFFIVLPRKQFILVSFNDLYFFIHL